MSKSLPVADVVVRERPLILSAEMVRGVIAGRKSQLRRLVGPETPFRVETGANAKWHWTSPSLPNGACRVGWGELVELMKTRCPLGAVGDHLWIQEQFAEVGNGAKRQTLYRATHVKSHVAGRGARDSSPIKWSLARQMLKPMSRLSLEIRGVCATRLHGISEGDAIAEGIFKSKDGWVWDAQNPESQGSATLIETFKTSQEAFEAMWRRFYGQAAWDTNPIVWKIDFAPIVRSVGALCSTVITS